MSFLSRAFAKAPAEARALSHAIPTVMEDHAMHTEAQASPSKAMTLGAFYACVTLLADTISSLSVKAFRDVDGASIEIEPQPSLFQNSPYAGLSWFDWLWMFMESLAVTGNAFGRVTQFDKYGRPNSIMPVHPRDITISTESDDADWLTPDYYIHGKRIPRDEIIHVRRFPIASRPYGMSPIEKAASTVGLGLAAERYGLRYFKDSANPSGLLTTDQELTPDQQKRNMRQWLQSHQGRRLPAMLTGGLKWQPVTITPEESQFLQTRQFQKSDIAMWFRIPPHMIGDVQKSTSWGTGIEEQAIGFVTYTLRPWLTCIEQVLTRQLPRGQYAKFNIDGLLRGDVKTRWEAYRLGRESGVYSVNDIRAFEDLPPVPEGNGRLQPMNFVPLASDPHQNQLELVEKQAEVQSQLQSEAAEQQIQQNTAPAHGGEEGKDDSP